MSSNSTKISLRISNQRAYIWDIDDIAIIRSKYNLCGVLTGTLPHLSQQNIFLGIPLVLMPEEVVFLVENGAAVLVADPTAHAVPTLDELQRWSTEQQQLFKQQIILSEKGAKETATSGRAMSVEALRKRKEREEKKKADAAHLAATVTNNDGPSAPVSVLDTLAVPSNALESRKNMPSIPYSVVVPASSSSFEWYNPSVGSYDTIELAREACVWSYPSNLLERAKCGVFRSLRDQGYFLGGGIKFGGDFLVYPGDPLRYHSHFVASVLESPTFPLRPMEIVAHGRLGTATKKAHLLCGWDDDKKEVSYLSIEWAGFG